jgi:hypothetical protein
MAQAIRQSITDTESKTKAWNFTAKYMRVQTSAEAIRRLYPWRLFQKSLATHRLILESAQKEGTSFVDLKSVLTTVPNSRILPQACQHRAVDAYLLLGKILVSLHVYQKDCFVSDVSERGGAGNVPSVNKSSPIAIPIQHLQRDGKIK